MVRHIETMGIRASNRLPTGYSRPGDDPTLGPEIDRLRQDLVDQLAAGSQEEPSALRALLSIKKRVGNCTEQSSIAYEFLRRKGAHGVAWISLRLGQAREDDHVLVVMGLTTRPPDSDSFTVGGNPPQSWGPNAVVCDPYFGKWFDVQSEWRDRVREFFPGVNLANGTHVTVECRRYAP